MENETMIAPYNEQAEQSVLGAIILEPSCMDQVRGQVNTDDFYRIGHRRLFAIMCEMRDDKKPIDMVTLTEELQKKNWLEEAGGVAYLTELASFVPTASNADYYAGIVREKAIRRDLMVQGQQLVSQAQRVENIEEIMVSSQEKIHQIQERTVSDDEEGTDLKSLLMGAFDLIEKRSMDPSGISGTPTGYADMDNMLNGLNSGDLMIVAARPAMGKTAFALNIGSNVAVREGKPVVVFSLEMQAGILSQRLLSMWGNIDSQSIRTGKMEEGDWDKLTDAISTLHDAPMKIHDKARSLNQIRANAIKFKRKHGEIGAIIIDYLQLINVEGNFANANERISLISRSLKLLAGELDCPIIALSQLSRAVEQRQDKRPMLSDLRDSGSIEQDADVVIFLYRDDYYDEESVRKNICEVIISKQRNGPVGSIELLFLKKYGKFLQLDKNLMPKRDE
ncbi:replicative DNA helicase [Thermoactinomyces sp. DSM 45892]|uniref:replicative DNA helicase n=1 Tax=Thermoactinomyces sp. DSM 45892 TaxID=1882753 RepID=UPI000898AAEE|nr:replicative DNA helicase [Thermoactinomyces sp. DSM 45892]SDY83619.1 replicative DNA helicase [Thermoactinomyces sp. DSM 45892]